MNTATATVHKDLVAGLGATGLSIARYLQRHDRDAMFFDSREHPPGVGELGKLWPHAELLLGEASLPDGVDRVIASPGISDSHPLLAAARRRQLEVVSDIELFAREAKAPFVAITGSNGKSTVTTLLHKMCVADGRKALAGGNLGEPALDLLDQPTPDLYVLELSSFQLQRTQSLPAHVAILLNVSPDHLDWHASESEYRESKYRVFREAAAAVVNREDAEAERRTRHLERVVSFGADAPREGQYGLRVNADGETCLARGETLLIAAKDLALYGAHNQLNALAALAAGELLGLAVPAMLGVLREFSGLPHRMQFVASIDGVDYINDSKATNVAAAIASIRSVDGPLILIAGGDGKGGDFTELSGPLKNNLRHAVLIGADARKIQRALGEGAPAHLANDMRAAVHAAAAYARPGDTVLLAPACASFDQFDNYMARGDAFASAVRELVQ
ncbi:MAG: UDP-N-acetylmuramoyl-L-alanine--D-glutamate ligase [Gammaproteobacteria bacterium]|nr:UDP-N-acetylmuramoyl-L-alanine--D-glutamate ligase [Gammaproteobacteria bacterium]